MYWVTLMMDGRFYCEGRLQDGTERWYKTTEAEAVKSMKEFAKVMNNTKLKRKDIDFLREVPVPSRTERIPMAGQS